MYELIKISENDYYIESPAKIGLVKVSDDEVILIDSGNDKDAGKKVLAVLNQNGWKLRAVLNTHSNADHIGGNKYLQNQTGCKIYAPGIECDFTNHTVLEPAFLYGGYPCKDLRHKFLMAQESVAEPLSEDVLPKGFEIIKLPGHFFDMVGFKTPDNTLYIADALSSREVIEKYKISVIYDVEAYIKTLENLKIVEACVFVPSHAAVGNDISELIQYNIEAVNAVSEKILDICREPLCFEAILQKIFTDYNLKMTLEQYVLVGSTVRSYLSWLKNIQKADIKIQDNMLLWYAL